MERQIILVVRLRRIERFQRHHLRHDRGCEHVLFGQRRDGRRGRAVLLGRRIKHHRAILRALVRPLAVELGGIVLREEDPQQLRPTGLWNLTC